MKKLSILEVVAYGVMASLAMWGVAHSDTETLKEMSVGLTVKEAEKLTDGSFPLKVAYINGEKVFEAAPGKGFYNVYFKPVPKEYEFCDEVLSISLVGNNSIKSFNRTEKDSFEWCD